jgi:hypothetical protein
MKIKISLDEWISQKDNDSYWFEIMSQLDLIEVEENEHQSN